MTNPTAAGYVTAWPSGTGQPLASNLNFVAGKTIANLVIVKVGANGKVSLYNSNGTTDLIADVVGYFSSDTDLNALSPARLLDTRSGSSIIDGQFAGGGALTAGGTLNLSVASRDGIPATGVSAVILNVTAVTPTAPGYLTLWPSDAPQPRRRVVPDELSTDATRAGAVDGYARRRLHERRPVCGRGCADQWQHDQPGCAQSRRCTGERADSVLPNVTVTAPTGAGYLTAFPAGGALPNTSNLNFVANQTISNLVIAKVGASGQVSLFNFASGGTSQIVVDVVGYFAGP